MWYNPFKAGLSFLNTVVHEKPPSLENEPGSLDSCTHWRFFAQIIEVARTQIKGKCDDLDAANRSARLFPAIEMVWLLKSAISGKKRAGVNKKKEDR
jgi:hypothetical protein